jgi:hypothetical protein
MTTADEHRPDTLDAFHAHATRAYAQASGIYAEARICSAARTLRRAVSAAAACVVHEATALPGEAAGELALVAVLDAAGLVLADAARLGALGALDEETELGTAIGEIDWAMGALNLAPALWLISPERTFVRRTRWIAQADGSSTFRRELILPAPDRLPGRAPAGSARAAASAFRQAATDRWRAAHTELAGANVYEATADLHARWPTAARVLFSVELPRSGATEWLLQLAAVQDADGAELADPAAIAALADDEDHPLRTAVHLLTEAHRLLRTGCGITLPEEPERPGWMCTVRGAFPPSSVVFDLPEPGAVPLPARHGLPGQSRLAA